MEVATVARWRRYGQDRLYVTAGDGTKLGWRDLATGADHIEAPDRTGEYLAAVSGWTDATRQVRATPPPRPDTPTGDSHAHTPAGPCAVDAWDDLAGRQAGAMAREQAIAFRQAAPVRTMVARFLGVNTEERAWRLGADGEEAVAAQLNRLAAADPRWRFLHAIPVGDHGSDIDHLVIGPGGVFSLNAKHHPDANLWVGGNTFLVNGNHQPYVRNSRHEAHRASRLLTRACALDVHVTGIVVPVGARRLTVKTQPDDVRVVARIRLAEWLFNQPMTIGNTLAEQIFETARRSTTWHLTTPAPR